MLASIRLYFARRRVAAVLRKYDNVRPMSTRDVWSRIGKRG